LSHQLWQGVFCSHVLLAVHFGLGRHLDDVPNENRPTALMWKWAGQIDYIAVSTLVKFVVGIFIARLCDPRSWQRITITVLLVTVGIFYILYMLEAIFQCRPIAYVWWREQPNSPVTGECNSTELATIPTYIAMILGVVSDWILALLPISLVRRLDFDWKTKISIVCVLAMGTMYAPSISWQT
jgi:hypothetical protein